MAISSNTAPVVYTESELTAMTKTELLVIAAAIGVTSVTNSNKKAEIIAAILEVQNAD